MKSGKLFLGLPFLAYNQGTFLQRLLFKNDRIRNECHGPHGHTAEEKAQAKEDVAAIDKIF